MNGEMYWLDVDGDRTGLEVIVNGVAAERLLHTHAIRFPINEFLRAGPNRIEVRMGPWPSNAGPDEAGEISIKLVCAKFDGPVQREQRTMAEQKGTFQAAQAGAVLLAADFAADRAGMAMPAFEPIGPAHQHLIRDQLGRIAQAWRDGDADVIATWMRPYLRDYARAYPLERESVMEDRVRRMVAAFKGGRVDFADGATAFEPIPGMNLVDCTGPTGAAVQVHRPATPPYNMWTVVGVRGDKVILFR